MKQDLKKQTFLQWKIKNVDTNGYDYKLNNKISNTDNVSLKKIESIYTNISPKNLEKFLKKDKDIWKYFSGIGIDLGGGIGLVSSVIAKNNNVKKIYCLDVVKNAVKKCQPIFIKKILGKKYKKVISVLGSFNNLEIKNLSIDFCIAWDAMHHSNNISKTLSEVKRVLKNNGIFIIIDRAHNNSTSIKEIKRMENIIYSKKFLEDNMYPPTKILTRKMNGEREYRYSDWQKFFKSSNFKVIKSIVMIEKNKKNKKKNDSKIEEKILNFKIGGFEQQKIIYVLKKIL